MTSKALEAARKAMWSAMNSSDTSDPAEACIRAFAQNLSEEAAAECSGEEFETGPGYCPTWTATPEKILRAIEKDLE